MGKPQLFLDMDNVMVNTLPVLNEVAKLPLMKDKPDQVTGIFRDLLPINGVVESVRQLQDYYDLYIVSTAPWTNPSAWQDKLLWIKQMFGDGATNPFYKHLIITHSKELVKQKNGLLIDDRPYHGASQWLDDELGSCWIQYGFDQQLTWENELTSFLIKVAKLEMQGMKLLPALASANDVEYRLHGDVKDFSKANWEEKG